ncbi:MAG: hypothetical protein K0U98_14785 [Deltaproteobacteria bacterium]|nr:hypothetical protein [Deltaproteobacteria bacterium]
MELPVEVLVHNPTLGVKGGKGTLLRVAAEGFYEMRLEFGSNEHRTLLPIQETVLILAEAEPPGFEGEFEIER